MARWFHRRSQQERALGYEVYVSGVTTFGSTSVLLTGKRDCVLIDAQFTDSEAAEAAEMVERSGTELTTVIVTHGHPDHYFGLASILSRFPGAKAVAARPVIDEITESMKAKVQQWKPIYKEDLTDSPVVPEELAGNVIGLEGSELHVYGPVQGDSNRCTYVHVPDIDLIAAGDTVYNGSHLYLADTNETRRRAWLKTLRRLERLRPSTIVAGHKVQDRTDDAKRVLASMRAYLASFGEAIDASESAEEVIGWMTSEYPTLEYPVLLKYSAEAAFPPTRR